MDIWTIWYNLEILNIAKEAYYTHDWKITEMMNKFHMIYPSKVAIFSFTTISSVASPFMAQISKLKNKTKFTFTLSLNLEFG